VSFVLDNTWVGFIKVVLYVVVGVVELKVFIPAKTAHLPKYLPVCPFGL